MAFGADAGSLEYLVGRARQVSQRPLIVKLSPNVTSIGQMARVSADAGADALSVANTFRAMSIDIETRRPRLSKRDRRTVRSGHQAHRATHGV